MSNGPRRQIITTASTSHPAAPMGRQHIQFVTGRLAEATVRRHVAAVADSMGFDYTVDVLGISVAALMTSQWVARHVTKIDAATEVMVPGYCRGDLSQIAEATGHSVVRGPKDIRELADYLGHEQTADSTYGEYAIEIIAEINHASSLSMNGLLGEADRLRRDGADVIDVGCEPGEDWPGVNDVVRALCDAGHRVSIDSLDPRLIGPAVEAGAELVLSVNSTNRAAAVDWGCEVVAIPDTSNDLESLGETVAFLDEHTVPYRIDPILEPIGFGFAASLARYWAVRERWPDAAMMMGIGNLTELTDVDSAGVNVLLLALCEELGVGSVLTTEVINWARTSVRECDVARRLAHHAVKHKTLPKHLDSRLVMLRDERVTGSTAVEIAALAADIRDRNYRILTSDDSSSDEGELHVVNGDGHHHGRDPFALFTEMEQAASKAIDARHAFYLGYEMAKAVIALTLGKTYRQDEALGWGMLTRGEDGEHHDWRSADIEPDE